MSTLFLCGAGNSEGVRLALAVQRHTREWDRIVLLDDDEAKWQRELLRVPIVGSTGELAAADPSADRAINLVTRTCGRRDAMQRRLAPFGVPFTRLIHPAVDCTGATLAADVTIYAGATIGPETLVADHAVVFMGAVVGHESTVGRGCVLAANAVLNARVLLDDRVYVGANATVIPEIHVGHDATIAAGSTVVQNVPAGATALGVPADIFMTGRIPPAHAPDDEPTGDVPADAAIHQAIVRAWQEVLSLDRIADEENFFDAGGTSLLAVRVAERIRFATGHQVGLVEMFQFPTVRRLAEHLSTAVPVGALSAAASRAEQRRLYLASRQNAR